MAEIIIDDPKINHDKLRGYSYPPDFFFNETLKDYMRSGGISPITHPLAADICAGDGSAARILVDHGWLPHNITCIDQYQSPTPLVDGITWLYWDVEILFHHLLSERSLPRGVEVLRNRFDMVFLLGSPLRSNQQKTVCEFLVRQEGIIFSNGFITPLRRG